MHPNVIHTSLEMNFVSRYELSGNMGAVQDCSCYPGSLKTKERLLVPSPWVPVFHGEAFAAQLGVEIFTSTDTHGSQSVDSQRVCVGGGGRMSPEVRKNEVRETSKQIAVM